MYCEYREYGGADPCANAAAFVVVAVRWRVPVCAGDLAALGAHLLREGFTRLELRDVPAICEACGREKAS
jgi:hypothetical protein